MFKTFLTIVIIFLILRFLSRLVGSVSQPQQGNFQGQQHQPNITVNKAPEKESRRFNKDDAEYVDYEEVD